MNRRCLKEKLLKYKKRINEWQENIKSTHYNKEQNTTIKFVTPLFEMLGWNSYSKDMEFEYLIYEKKGRIRHADIALSLKNCERPKILVEIKPVQHKILGSSQIFKYIRDAGVTYGVITNGKELKIYDRRYVRHNYKRGRKLFSLKLEDFVRYNDVLSLLSKHAVEKGMLDKLAQAYHSKYYWKWYRSNKTGELARDKYELPLKFARLNM